MRVFFSFLELLYFLLCDLNVELLIDFLIYIWLVDELFDKIDWCQNKLLTTTEFYHSFGNLLGFAIVLLIFRWHLVELNLASLLDFSLVLVKDLVHLYDTYLTMYVWFIKSSSSSKIFIFCLGKWICYYYYICCDLFRIAISITNFLSEN